MKFSMAASKKEVDAFDMINRHIRFDKIRNSGGYGSVIDTMRNLCKK